MRQILISFDTTGSMTPALREVRRRLSTLLDKMMSSDNQLEIAIIAHGDYCDGVDAITHVPFTKDKDSLIRFVNGVRSTSGGDYEEFYGLVMHYALNVVEGWIPDSDKSLVMIGDATPHQKWHHKDRAFLNHFPYYKDIDIYWKEQLDCVRDSGVTLYAVQCLDRATKTEERVFWGELGRTNQGAHITLSQFELLPELLEAIQHKESGNLTQHIENMPDTLRLNVGFAEALAKLTGDDRHRDTAVHHSRDSRKRFSSEIRTTGELEPVEPTRFQRLRVSEVTTIRDFVEDSLGGENYKRGRGFYQLSKTETVQERKEVILLHRATGDMYSGSLAREMIGVPYGSRGRVSPRGASGVLREYDVFVQSTSYTRKLMPDTGFLYET